MIKKIIYITSLIIIDGIISFIVFFLFVFGFGTMPRVSDPNEDYNLAQIKIEVLQYLSENRGQFLIELLIGLILVFLTTYLFLRNITKKPFLLTSVVCVLYLTGFIILYLQLCKNFIAGNMEY